MERRTQTINPGSRNSHMPFRVRDEMVIDLGAIGTMRFFRLKGEGQRLHIDLSGLKIPIHIARPIEKRED